MKYTLLVNGNLNIAAYQQYASDYDYLVGVDGGTQFAYNHSLNPDLIIGDMDSLDPAVLFFYEKKGCRIVKYQPEKDNTDSAIAIEYAMNCNATQIILAGGVGDRFDHSYANICLLNYITSRDIDAKIITDKHVLQIITSELSFQGEKGKTLSLLPFAGDVTGVTLTGLKYPLNNATLVLDSPIGISNIIEEDEAIIRIDEGNHLLAVLCI